MIVGALKTLVLCFGLLTFCYTFIVSGTIINLLQCCTLVVWPFNKDLYRCIKSKLVELIWLQMVYLAEFWSGSDFIMYSDSRLFENFGRETGLVILNHKYDVDWLMGWIICQRYNILGSCKLFAKKPFRYTPFLGWSFAFLEGIFVHRDWRKDKQHLNKCLKILAEYPVNYLLLMFCEGTRFTEQKKKISNEVARTKGLPELKHHLLPRTNGFVVTVEAFKGKVPAIYDCTLAFSKDHAEPTLYNIAMRKKCMGHMLFRRIELKDVPTDSEEETSMFCHKMYQYKDRAFDYFLKHQTFEGFDGKRGRKIPRNYKPLINELFWNITLCVPTFYYIGGLLLHGPIWYTVIAAIVIVLGVLFMRALINLSDIKRGSEYGSKSKTVRNGDTKQD